MIEKHVIYESIDYLIRKTHTCISIKTALI